MRGIYLEGGDEIVEGVVLIPFYSDGSSESFTIDVSHKDGTSYFKKLKHNKNLRIVNEI